MKRILTLVTAITLTSGTLLFAETTWLSNSSKVQWKDAPAAVKNAIKSQISGAKLEDLEKGTLNGRTVYEAAYKHNGQHTELRVAEDGTIVDTIVAGVSQGAGKASQTAQTAAASTGYESGFEQKLSGAKKVSMNDVPGKIKSIIQERSGGAKIEDIDKGTAGGKTLYEVAYKKNGQHTELRVSEDGKFVHEVVGGKTTYWNLPASGFDSSLTEASKVNYDQLPENIKKAIKDRIGDAQVKSVAQGKVNGKPTYQVAYMQNNKAGDLRLSEDGKAVRQVLGGQVIYESAGASSGLK